jgi:hypothetical protein
MSVNKMAKQNVLQHHSVGAWGEVKSFEQGWVTQVVMIATLKEFYKTDRFFTTFCDLCMGLL